MNESKYAEPVREETAERFPVTGQTSDLPGVQQQAEVSADGRSFDHRPPARPEKRKSKAGKIFVRTLEVLAIGGSYFTSSRLARFFTTKVVLDIQTEITVHFGRDAGHQMATVLAAIVAEPRIIAAVVTGVILFINLIAFLCRKIGGRRRRRKHNPPAYR